MKPLPIVLGIVALVTAVPAWSRPSAATTLSADLAGQLLVKGGKEVAPEQISGLRVVTWDDSAGTAKRFEVKRSGNAWIIPSHFDYPADGGTRVGKTAGGVLNVKRGRLVTQDPSQYEELGVIDPLDQSSGIKKGRGKRITLSDQTGAVVVDLIVGNRPNDGDGVSFVREVDSKEVYTAKVDVDISTRFVDWVETDLLKLKKDDLRKVLIEDYSVDADKGTINQRGETAIDRKDGGADWSADSAPTGKRLAKDVVDKLLSEATGLKLAGIRPFSLEDLQRDGFFPLADQNLLKEPNALVLSLGGRPYALYSNEGRLDLVTKDGLDYSLVFGNVSVDDEEADQSQKPAQSKDAAKDKAAVKDAAKEDGKDAAKPHNRFMAVFVRYDETHDDVAKEQAAAEAKKSEKDKDKKDAKDKPTGRERASKVSARFLKFFYVISDDSFKNMRPALDKLFEDKPKEPMAGSTGKTNLQWLDENSKKTGITTTATGLQYEIVSSGPATGRKPGPTDEVSVTYKGTLIDGKVFDESGKNGGGPATFRVDGVIKGWTEALQLMREGDKWKLYIKPELAYGDKGQPPTIGANEILTFEVGLVKVVTPAKPDAAKPEAPVKKGDAPAKSENAKPAEAAPAK